MTTHASIAMLMNDNTVKMTTVHYDGYLTYVGKTLVKYYSDFDKTKKLIDLGEISWVGKELEPSKMIKFSSEEFRKLSKAEQKKLKEDDSNHTVAYHRDYGEELSNWKFKSIPAYLNFLKKGNYSWCDYNYFLGCDESAKPQWYLVLETGFKPLYFDPQHVDVKNTFALNTPQINIADNCKLEESFDYRNPEPINKVRKLKTELKAKAVIRYLLLLEKKYDLGTPKKDEFGYNAFMPRFHSFNTSTVKVCLKEPGSEDSSYQFFYIDLFYVNPDMPIPRQVLKQLVNELHDRLIGSIPKYTLDQLPTLKKVNELKTKVANFYRTKYKYDPDSVAFRYLVALCRQAEDDEPIDTDDFDYELKPYVKKKVEKLFNEINTTSNDLNVKDILSVVNVKQTSKDYDENSERLSPFDSYLNVLITNDDPSDPKLFDKPEDKSTLFKLLSKEYRSLVARDTENVLIQANQLEKILEEEA